MIVYFAIISFALRHWIYLEGMKRGIHDTFYSKDDFRLDLFKSAEANLS